VCVPGKAVVSMPVGGGPAMMNNYMIAQPPGFQLAAFVRAALFVVSVLYTGTLDLPFIKQPHSRPIDCIRVDYQNFSVLCCVRQMCT